MKWILLIVTLTSSSLLFAAKDPVVAEVNGKTIRKSTLMAFHEQNLNFVQANKDTSIEASLNQLIDREIGINSARKAGLDKDPVVVKKMNDVLYHAYISKELTPKLQAIKPITDKEVKKYFNQNPEYKTSQILLRLRTVPSPEEVGETLKLANQIYNEAKKDPNAFSELAKRYGQTSTSLTGGDMGFQPRSRLSKEYYEAIRGRKVGFVTKPVRSQYGIHIVKVTGIRKYSEIDKNLYKSIIRDQKRDSILKSYFDKKRKSVKVKINKKHLKL